MQILKKGMRGEEVRKLQRQLGVTPVDGVYGLMTENAVKELQLRNGLYPDGIAGPKTMEILKQSSSTQAIDPCVEYIPINMHLSKKSSASTPKYLVIHYTAGKSSAQGAAIANRGVFLTRDASADFVVDDATILQVNPDPTKYYCWAVGDGKGAYGISNSMCVSIEICSNLRPGTSAAMPNHEGWYFTEASLSNAARLAKIIMRRYNIPLARVVRHYDASRKACPGVIGWNDGSVYTTGGVRIPDKKNNSQEWEKWKKRLT